MVHILKIFWHEWTGGEERGEGLQQSKIKQKISKAGTAENEKLQEREREREREREKERTLHGEYGRQKDPRRR